MSEDSKEAEEETALIEADDGERVSCVIQRVLITPNEENNPQRHCLFKTRCTINGREEKPRLAKGRETSNSFEPKGRSTSNPLQDRLGKKRRRSHG